MREQMGTIMPIITCCMIFITKQFFTAAPVGGIKYLNTFSNQLVIYWISVIFMAGWILGFCGWSICSGNQKGTDKLTFCFLPDSAESHFHRTLGLQEKKKWWGKKQLQETKKRMYMVPENRVQYLLPPKTIKISLLKEKTWATSPEKVSERFDKIICSLKWAWNLARMSVIIFHVPLRNIIIISSSLMTLLEN